MNCTHKQSRNNIIISKTEDSYIVANTRTRSVVELTAKAFNEFSNGDISKIDELTESDFNELVEMGFLLPENLDEDALLDFLLQKERLNNHTLLVYVMYSTACNFACQYCYEKGDHVKIQSMSEQTVQDLIEWFSMMMQRDEYKECKVILFGGEPLLYPDFFATFLNKIDLITKDHSVHLVTEVITNGYLLTNEWVEMFMPFNLKSIQVTLDGPPEAHNKLRPLRSTKTVCQGTFDTILDNILRIANTYIEIYMLCRISFNKANLLAVPQLIDILNNRDPKHKINIYFAHTTQTYSQIDDKSSFCSRNVYTNDIELAECYIFLWKEAKKRQYIIPSFMTLGPCMFYSANGFVITPHGDLYKCLDMVGVEKLSVGNIGNLHYMSTDYYKIVQTKKINSCLQTDCPFIPICGSGCVIEPWLKYGDFNKVCCKRNFLEKVHNELLLEKHK